MAQLIVETLFSDSWAFNIIAICEGYSSDGERLFFLSKEDRVGEIGNVQALPPVDLSARRRLALEFASPHTLRAIIYAIPCQIPSGVGVSVDDNPPFDMTLRVESSSDTIYSQSHSVNRWGGASIELNLKL